MKKIKLVIFITFYNIICLAQIPVGFKAGTNVNSKNVKNLPQGLSDNSTSQLGFHAGVFTMIGISDKLKVIPELQFIRKGYSYTDGTGQDVTIDLNYLELPVLVSYSVVGPLRLEAGPSFAIKLSAIAKASGSSAKQTYFESTDFGINGGVRLNFLKRFSLICRYYQGISPANKIEYNSGPTTPGASVKEYNRNVQLSVAYLTN